MTTADAISLEPPGVGQALPPLLKVLRGPRAGATHWLEIRGSLLVSTGWHADIVLRDRAHPFRAELAWDSEGRMQLRVLEGEACLLGAAASAGRACLWPPFIPLAIGPHVLAYGDARSPRWQEAVDLAALPAARLALPAADDPAQPEDDAFFGLVRRLKGLPAMPRRMLSGGVAIAALGAALAVNPTARMPTWVNGAAAAERILEDEGLDAVLVEEDAAGTLRLTGAVSDREALSRAVVRLREAGISHHLDLVAGDDLAAAAEDIARQHGVTAIARATAPDAIALSLGPMSAHDLRQLIAAIRADLPALRNIDVSEGLSPTDVAAPRTVSEAAKRIAMVVAGEPGYVVTADGARYFRGALLPSGHVLKGIEEGAILVERNGATTRIQF